jgi:hypothetical protein
MEVALLLLAIGLLTTVPLAVRSLGQVREASALEHANLIAVAILDSLAQLRNPVAGSIVRDGIALDWTPQLAGVGIRIELRAVWVDGRHSHVDSLIAFTGPWPPRLHAVP